MKEALKLALEALEDFADVIKYDNEQDDIGRKACCGVLSYNPHSESCKAKQAITAIKAALAQPAPVPLTIQHIKCMDYRGTLDEHIRAVRMTEAAHGIKETTE
jgi:hypothetical protein